MFYSFLSFEMNLEYDQNNFEFPKTNTFINGLKNFLLNNKQIYINILELWGIFKSIRDLIISFNKISINFTFPKYKIGFSFILKIPELHKIIKYIDK